MNVKRSGSSAYWDSEAWNPDDRVYVGACDGQTHHLHAVSPEGALPTTHASKDEAAALSGSIQGGSRDYWETFQAEVSASPAQSNLPLPATAAFGHPVNAPGEASINALQQGYPSRNDGGSAYWDEYHTQAGKACKTETVAQDTEKSMKRVNSGAYWDAEQWDPDLRVYVGAEAGMQNHLQAIDPSRDEAPVVWRVWAGGLSSEGLNRCDAPLIDLQSGPDKVRLEDLYEILDQSVGSGSFGVVRRSQHRSTGKECVVKSVRKEAAGERYRALLIDRHLGERLLWMSQKAKHPNIATYFDIMEGPQHFFIVMEELLGAELMEQVEELFPVTEAYLQGVIKQVFQALSHLHSKVGLVHRDVKLSNFRFRDVSSTTLALLDFGFAMNLSEPWDGAVCGTLMFMAPEVIGCKAAAPNLAAMDVWAAGVMLYVLLTGDAPAEEDQVRLFGRGGPAAESALDAALTVQALEKASGESLALLRQILVLDPARRITAGDALRHEWFQSPVEREVFVPLEKYRRARSVSMNSQASTPKAWPRSRERTPKKMLDLPQRPFEPLERIVSEGVEEIKN